MSFFWKTKQQSQATTIENLKSETGWQFTVLLIKKTECSFFYKKKQMSLWIISPVYALLIECEIH